MDMQPMQPVYMYVCIYMSWKCVCILCCCVDCVPAAAAIYIRVVCTRRVYSLSLSLSASLFFRFFTRESKMPKKHHMFGGSSSPRTPSKKKKRTNNNKEVKSYTTPGFLSQQESPIEEKVEIDVDGDGYEARSRSLTNSQHNNSQHIIFHTYIAYPISWEWIPRETEKLIL